jgi:hypothetical protein
MARSLCLRRAAAQAPGRALRQQTQRSQEQEGLRERRLARRLPARATPRRIVAAMPSLPDPARAMPAPPRPAGPLHNAAAWYGPALSRRTDWIVALDAGELAEIEAAMLPWAAGNRDIAQLRREDFPLPRLAPRLAHWLGELLDGRGFVLVRGLPVQRWTLRQSATAFFGLGSHLGNARSQNGQGHVLGHVRDLGLRSSDPNVRIYQTPERQTFHTDSCDIVGLLCLQSARSGGLSALVSSTTIFNEMLRRRPDLVDCLFEPIATDRRGEVPLGQKPFFEIPVFNWHEDLLSVIYQRQYIDSAQRFEQAPRITARQRAALDLFDALANDPALHLHMAFQPGDMQFVHNHTLLHDRTAFQDWPEAARRRHLLRLWLAPRGARPLPAVFAQRYGSVTPGERGGIMLPATRLQAPLEAC